MSITSASAALPQARVRPGDVIPQRELVTVMGERIALPGPTGVTHLQLRRFAGCPVCNLHLQSVVRRHDELLAAGVREVAVFHSSADELRKHVADLPIHAVADPGKRLYVEFRVESSPKAMLHPRAWWPIVRAVAASLVGLVRGTRKAPKLFPDGGRYGLPADFLIAPDGRVIAAKYGDHVYDQWSVDEVLDLARAATAADGR